MKKIMCVLFAAIMVFSLSSCMAGNSRETESADLLTETQAAETTESITAETTKEETASGTELALITVAGSMEDNPFNHGAWEGLKQYAAEHGVTAGYYQPKERTTASYLETIAAAVDGDARLIVCPAALFEDAVGQAQERYPDVKFILIDGVPVKTDESGETRTAVAANTYCIRYAEEQAGFLAGYAAVYEGYTKLGFIGGMKVPAVIRYGYGFVQGADYAAKELGIKNVSIKYSYTGSFEASLETQALAASWYQSGTELIFGCGGAVGSSCMAAAKAADAKVIGVDLDQSELSDTVLTSAMKELRIPVYDAVKAFYEGTFPGGTVQVFDVKNHSIGLPMENSGFMKFTSEDYERICRVLQDKTVLPELVTDADSAEILPVEMVKIEEIVQ